MLEAMLEGWRGKRVLIVGDRGGLCAFLIAVLDEIGARPVCVSDRADAQTLCRALTAGRVSAAILPGEMTGRSLPERLEATLTLTREMREAGVPLLLAMSDAAVYRGGGRVNEAGEIGGRTREGLEASILQTALLGAARGCWATRFGRCSFATRRSWVKTARRGATRCWRGGRSGCAIRRRAECSCIRWISSAAG